MPRLHHTQQRPLSPNLFPLNARFLPSPHSHCLCAPHPPMMLGIASTSSCLCVCLSCSRYKRRAVFAAYLDTRACLPHISPAPDPFDPFAILKFRSRGCYYWEWLLHQIYSCCDVRRLPSINLSTAPLSSSSSYNHHRPTLNHHHRHHDQTWV